MLSRKEIDRIADKTGITKHQMRIIHDYASSIGESIIHLDLATDQLAHGYLAEDYYCGFVESKRKMMRKDAERLLQMLQDPEEEN